MNASKRWSAAELSQHISEPSLAILDVRNASDFARASIDTAGTIINIPAPEIRELGADDDLVASVKKCAEKGRFSDFSPDLPLVVVCARGKTSQQVAQGLRDCGYSAVDLNGGMENWGNYYEFRTVESNSEFTITQVSRPARGCLSYILSSQNEAIVIDPFRHIEPYLEMLKRHGQNLQVKYVVDTHAHADHISGGVALAKKLGASYCLHPYDAIHPFDLIPGTIAYDPIFDDTRLSVGLVTITALHLPGHTLGNLGYLLKDKYLFAGDTVFLDSIARPDLGNKASSWASLHYRSLRRIHELPSEVVVLPGHFQSMRERNEHGIYSNTLKHIKASNPEFELALKSEADFMGQILSHARTIPENYIEIKRVNAGLIVVDDARAGELELGKNLCAVSHK